MGNPFANMIPCWKYVRENNINDQLEHIKRELAEAKEELNFENLLLECFDILQAAITLMYILQIKYGIDLHELVEKGQKKNAARKYYE
jgi:NTP pyrophosphatase (non-canonical NTP hydrolase)